MRVHKKFSACRYVLQVTTEWVLKSASQQMYPRLIYIRLFVRNHNNCALGATWVYNHKA